MKEPWYIKETINYRNDRYMDHLSEDELNSRLNDVVVNCIEINKDGKISPDMSDDYGQFFWVRWTHIIEEYRLRFGSTKEMFKRIDANKIHFPKNFDLIQSSNNKIKSISFDKDRINLYKYGKSEYLKKYLKTGEIRIAPASYYNDPSLNHAINDDELNFRSQQNLSKIKMEVFDNLGNLKGVVKSPKGQFVYKSATNYYVYCLSTVLSPRLFVEFDNSDSCLIIKDSVVFLKKIIEGFLNKVDNFSGAVGEVKYIDPIFTNPKEYDPFYSKHFRYAYQREFRIVFIPFENNFELPNIDLQLGNLENCCELIELEKT